MLLQNERKVSPAQKQVTRYSFVSFRPLQEMLESENHLRVSNSSLNSGGPNGDTQAGLRARARSARHASGLLSTSLSCLTFTKSLKLV